MLGDTGQGPITDGNGPGRLLAIAAAVALVLGGGYYALFGAEGLTFAMPELASSAKPAATVPVTAISAAPPMVRPSLRPTYVYDQADVLSDEAAANLDTVLGALHTRAGPELVVMTVPSLGGAAIDVFARKVANQWGFGDAARKDGVLLLIAPNEKQVRITVGEGLEASLTNSDCQKIIDQHMLPLFREGALERATVAGALALTKHLAAHPTLSPKAR